MFYIIGLGNPGEKYSKTKHNVGWLIFEEIISSPWAHHKYMNAEIKNHQLGLFIKPQTFMNKSGEIISFLKKEIAFAPDHVIVLYDDIDLPFGSIRVSCNRGDGGHNGVKSITQHLGSKKFIRIRVGVSRSLENGQLVKPNVLGNFSPQELEIISSQISSQVGTILQSLSDQGLEKTMNLYNS